MLDIFTPQNPLILASKSPQRSQILQMMEIPFVTIHSNFEEILDNSLSPERNAEVFAEGKAEDVFQKNPNSFVVGVDTLVLSSSRKILGKPENEEEVREMYREKSGKTEKVISGICVCFPDGKKIVRHETAEITFLEISNEEIERILSMEEWRGVSGAIRVDGKSAQYIKKIHGNFWNIVGFPIPTFLEMMEKKR